MNRVYEFISLAVLMIFLQACGSGGSGGVVPRVQKTAIVEFATATTGASTKIRGVYIEATLPLGVTVATKDGTTEISSGALQGVSGQVLLGTYSAAVRKVKIPVVSVSSVDIAIGPYAKLNCDIVPGNTLLESQFSSIVPNNFEATGSGGVDLTIATPPVVSKISATFGY